MGWIFYDFENRAYVINDVTKNIVSQDGKRSQTCIAKSVRGNQLWTVWIGQEVETGYETHREIVLFLLSGDKRGAGYKDMSESMHPYFYDCPVSFLDQAAETCPEWRVKVRALAAKKAAIVKRKIEVGKTYALYGCVSKSIRITQISPKIVGVADDGCAYRVPKTRIGVELVVDPVKPVRVVTKDRDGVQVFEGVGA